MIGRAKGATLAEIMKAVQWQAHSVRGFISTAGKKQGIKIEFVKNEAGDRVYKITCCRPTKTSRLLKSTLRSPAINTSPCAAPNALRKTARSRANSSPL
jgi:hypothetical protein